MSNQTKKESVCGYCKQPFRGGTLCPHTLNQTKPKNQCSFNHRELPNCKVCEKLGCNHQKEQGVEKTIGQMKIATFGLKEELKDFPDIMEVISAQIAKAREEEIYSQGYTEGKFDGVKEKVEAIKNILDISSDQ